MHFGAPQKGVKPLGEFSEPFGRDFGAPQSILGVSKWVLPPPPMGFQNMSREFWGPPQAFLGCPGGLFPDLENFKGLSEEF